MIKERVITFKTKTNKQDLSRTYVYKPLDEVVVIDRHILADKNDQKEGWYTNATLVKNFKNKVLLKEQIIFFNESFELIKTAVNALNHNIPL